MKTLIESTKYNYKTIKAFLDESEDDDISYKIIDLDDTDNVIKGNDLETVLSIADVLVHANIFDKKSFEMGEPLAVGIDKKRAVAIRQSIQDCDCKPDECGDGFSDFVDMIAKTANVEDETKKTYEIHLNLGSRWNELAIFKN